MLIVEDDPGIRELISDLIESLGFQTLCAEGNEAAFRLLRDRTLTLITTDLNRPGGSGLDFVRDIRSMPVLARVPIIMISGNATQQLELLSWRAGISAFLEKPISFQDLFETIARLTEQPSETDSQLIALGLEGRDLDYKEKLDLASKVGIAELARDVIAMANSGGGRLVIGVAESHGQFSIKGIPESDLPNYEITRLNDKIRRFVGSMVAVSTRIVKTQGLNIIMVEIDATKDTLAMPLASHERAGLFLGRVYIRTQDGRTTELTDSLQLQRLIDRLVEQRIKNIYSSFLLRGQTSTPS